MDTIKRLSSSLKTQLLNSSGAGQLVSPPSSQRQTQRTIKSSQSNQRNDIESSCQNLLDSSNQGEIFFKTDGKFHAFVLRVEEAVISILLHHFEPADLLQVSSAFISRAVQYCPDYDPMDVAYSASQIGTIRSSIRVIASKEPGRILDHIDAIFAMISSACGMQIPAGINNETLRREAHSLRKLSSAQLSYQPLQDDPFALVFHSKRSKTVPTRIRISGCGVDQVHGVYLLSNRYHEPIHDHDWQPVYRHPDGYIITRTKKIITTICSPEEDSERDINQHQSSSTSTRQDGQIDTISTMILYMWNISQPALACSYYCCCTMDSSPMPPALGWKQFGPLGRLPGPQVTVITSDTTHPMTPMNHVGEVGVEGDSTVNGGGFREVENNNNHGYTSIPVGEFVPVVPSSTTMTSAVVRGDEEPLQKKNKNSIRKTKVVVVEKDIDDQHKRAKKDNGLGENASSVSSPISDKNSIVLRSDSNPRTEISQDNRSIQNNSMPGGDSDTPMNNNINSLVEQLRDECETLLNQGDSTEHLLELYRKYDEMKLSLSHKATAILRKIEWLGQVVDTNELLAGCIDINKTEMDDDVNTINTVTNTELQHSSPLFNDPVDVVDDDHGRIDVPLTVESGMHHYNHEHGKVDHIMTKEKLSQSTTTGMTTTAMTTTAMSTTSTINHQLTKVPKSSSNNHVVDLDDDDDEDDDDEDQPSLYNIYNDGDNSNHRLRRKSLLSTGSTNPPHHHTTPTLTSGGCSGIIGGNGVGASGGVGGGGGSRVDALGVGTGILAPLDFPLDRLLSMSHDSADQSSVTTGVTNRSYSHHRGGWGDRDRDKEKGRVPMSLSRFAQLMHEEATTALHSKSTSNYADVEVLGVEIRTFATYDTNGRKEIGRGPHSGHFYHKNMSIGGNNVGSEQRLHYLIRASMLEYTSILLSSSNNINSSNNNNAGGHVPIPNGLPVSVSPIGERRKDGGKSGIVSSHDRQGSISLFPAMPAAPLPLPIPLPTLLPSSLSMPTRGSIPLSSTKDKDDDSNSTVSSHLRIPPIERGGGMHRGMDTMIIDDVHQPRQVFTVRRDLTSLCAFHAELTDLLRQLRLPLHHKTTTNPSISVNYPIHHHGTNTGVYDITLPIFPDPFLMGPIEEMLLTRHKELTGQSGAKSPGTLSRFSLTRLLFHSPKQGGPGLGPGSASGSGLGPTAQGSGRRGGTPSPGSVERHGLGPGLGSGTRPRVEERTHQNQQNSFAYTTPMRRSWMTKTKGKGTKPTEDLLPPSSSKTYSPSKTATTQERQELKGVTEYENAINIITLEIQRYLKEVFALMAAIEQWAANGPAQGLGQGPGPGLCPPDLPTMLGRLVGRFLLSTDSSNDEMNDTNNDGSPLESNTHIDRDADMNPIEDDDNGKGDEGVEGVDHRITGISQPPMSPLRASDTAQGPGLGPGQGLGSNRLIRPRPCWHAFSSGGLKLYLSTSDEFGGRLSLKSDEELLRLQRGRCMGCGEPISHTGLFGFLPAFDRNYQLCRYHGGLFCRKWCHGDDYRQIPHRLLLYWDHTPHRVSRQAAAFLDKLWNRPILLVNSVNPLLYEGIPALRLARSMRVRALQHIVRILGTDGERNDVKEVILSILGADRIHLCLTDDLYSMRDLLSVQSGELHTTLDILITALRDRDRTLGRDPTIPQHPPQLSLHMTSSNSHGNLSSHRGSKTNNSSSAQSHRAIGYTGSGANSVDAGGGMSPSRSTVTHSRRVRRSSSRDKG